MLYSKLLDDCLGLVRQAGDERSCRLAACQPDPLARPERQKLRSTLLRRCRPERPRQRILQREGKNGVSGVRGLDSGHEAVDDAPRRAPGEGARQPRLVLPCPSGPLRRRVPALPQSPGHP